MNNNDNLELASIKSRTFAFIIDDFLVSFIMIAMYWDIIAQNGNDVVAIMTIMNEFIIQVLALKFIYQTFFIWYYGATIGKIITKIRVIDFNHLGRVSIFTSMTRSILRIVSELFFYFGFIFALLSDSRQTFHDKLGRTLVVNA